MSVDLKAEARNLYAMRTESVHQEWLCRVCGKGYGECECLAPLPKEERRVPGPPVVRCRYCLKCHNYLHGETCNLRRRWFTDFGEVHYPKYESVLRRLLAEQIEELAKEIAAAQPERVMVQEWSSAQFSAWLTQRAKGVRGD